MIEDLQRVVSDKDALLSEKIETIASLEKEGKERGRQEHASRLAEVEPDDPLQKPAFMTEREIQLTERLQATEKERDEWTTTIADYQKRIEELIVSEENLMSLNQ